MTFTHFRIDESGNAIVIPQVKNEAENVVKTESVNRPNAKQVVTKNSSSSNPTNTSRPNHVYTNQGN